MARKVALMVRAHQPRALRTYDVFDITAQHDYFQPAQHRSDYMASCVRANRSLLQLLRSHEQYALSLNLTGAFLEQAERDYPEVIESIRQLVVTDRVDFIVSPYYNDISYFYSTNQFERSVQAHQDLLQRLFGVTSRIIVNTELAYDTSFGEWADRHGFAGVVADGTEEMLAWRSPNYVYQASRLGSARLLVRNRQLSDDLALRFNDRGWSQWPLTAEKYADWLMRDAGEIVLLAFDYAAFEARLSGDDLMSFLGQFIDHWVRFYDGTFTTLHEAVQSASPTEVLSVPHATSWVDDTLPLATWTHSALQKDALRTAYALEGAVMQSGDMSLLRDWQSLLSADIIRSLDQHDAFLSYMNMLRDVQWRAS